MRVKSIVSRRRRARRRRFQRMASTPAAMAAASGGRNGRGRTMEMCPARWWDCPLRQLSTWPVPLFLWPRPLRCARRWCRPTWPTSVQAWVALSSPAAFLAGLLRSFRRSLLRAALSWPPWQGYEPEAFMRAPEGRRRSGRRCGIRASAPDGSGVVARRWSVQVFRRVNILLGVCPSGCSCCSVSSS